MEEKTVDSQSTVARARNRCQSLRYPDKQSILQTDAYGDMRRKRRIFSLAISSSSPTKSHCLSPIMVYSFLERRLKLRERSLQRHNRWWSLWSSGADQQPRAARIYSPDRRFISEFWMATVAGYHRWNLELDGKYSQCFGSPNDHRDHG